MLGRPNWETSFTKKIMTPRDEFLSPLCSYRTIANFIPRRAVLNALTAELSRFQGTVLDIGCGRKPYPSLLPSRDQRHDFLQGSTGSR
jgi:hypothetical protein